MPNKHATLDSLFKDIADSIREKTGSNGLIIADNFPDEIDNITITDIMPEKGDLIKLNGEDTLYRVLKITGSIAEVLSMSDSSSKAFSSSSTKIDFVNPDGSTTNSPKYAGSTLDDYLNNTYYESLSDAIKSAIVKQYVIQHAYNYSASAVSPAWHGKRAFSSQIDFYIQHEGYIVPVGERYVYALDVKDIVDYVGENNLISSNINKMLYDSNEAVNNRRFWLRSAKYSSGNGWVVEGNSDWGTPLDSRCTTANHTRAVFTIDLSQCEWSVV